MSSLRDDDAVPIAITNFSIRSSVFTFVFISSLLLFWKSAAKVQLFSDIIKIIMTFKFFCDYIYCQFLILRGDKVYTLSYLYCIRNDYYGGILPSFCFIASFVLYVRFPAFSAGIFLSIPGSSDEPLRLSRSRVVRLAFPSSINPASNTASVTVPLQLFYNPLPTRSRHSSGWLVGDQCVISGLFRRPFPKNQSVFHASYTVYIHSIYTLFVKHFLFAYIKKKHYLCSEF